MIPFIFLTLLASGSVFSQELSSGNSALSSEQVVPAAYFVSAEQAYSPAGPGQPAGPSQPSGPGFSVSMLAPVQPLKPVQPGQPLAPTDPQFPGRSPMVSVFDPTLPSASVVTFRVPGQLQNVSQSLGTLFKNLNIGGN